MLWLLPDSWAAPLMLPIARRLRRSFVDAALTIAPLAVVIALGVVLLSR